MTSSRILERCQPLLRLPSLTFLKFRYRVGKIPAQLMASIRLQGLEANQEQRNGKDERSQPRVLRGGSWHSTEWDCRSAGRLCYRPGVRGDDFGFRVWLVRGSAASHYRGPKAEPRDRTRHGNRFAVVTTSKVEYD